MAIRWLYVTNHPEATNYCTGMTSDDNNTDIPESDELPDTFRYAWTAPDPDLEPPALRDLVPLKRYNVSQNRIYVANQAQVAAWNLSLEKSERYSNVDEKTYRLYNKGFSHDGEKFNLQPEDDIPVYLMWYENTNNSVILTYPYDILTWKRDLYTVNNVNSMKAFCEAAFTRRTQILNETRDIKKQIFDAVDMATLDAITDDRI